MQQKDVIYIDVEDDITAIIGKVKSAKEKIVALVPPKRTGVLQSAVNLRLLARAADNDGKHLVLITGNGALGSLAASAKIPVAKTLQSRPELAQIPDITSEDDDIIDGEQLPVGDHAGIADDAADILPASSIKGISIDDDDVTPVPYKPADAAKPARKKTGIKVPNFGSFRKKLAFAILGAILLIVFLVWAIGFAPRATVVISAKTTDQAIKTAIALGPDLVTSSDDALIKSSQQSDKVSQSVDFDATGTKDVGERATGTVTFSTRSIGDLGTTIPAGTQLTASGGMVFTTTQSITFTLNNYTGASSGIIAAASGTQYNGASGSASGAPGNASAQITGTTAGGTEKIVKIVLQADVQKAKEQLAAQNTDIEKKKLIAKFDNSTIVIDSSFGTKGGEPVSAPAVGQEATTGKAKLTLELTYTMEGVAKSELTTYLDASFKKTLTNANQQRVYDNGLSTVKFDEFKQGDRSSTANISATAQIGPKINDDAIKQQVKGKRTGEVIGDLKAIDGVSDVEVKLSPFWVSGVPDDVKKITIEFKLIKNG
ncbi:MAG: hypothetical protein JWN75_729 [Candidatus Saccharibacteria bacterium]|nr:hypothetical protein [Candidatus Saccharibacteria bacterium]